MTAPARLLLVSLCATLGACAAKRAAPVQRYALGPVHVEYRDYASARTSPCDAGPRWVADELKSVNALLERFLSGTEEAGAATASHLAQRLELLQEAARTLPPVLEVYGRNLAALPQCRFHNKGPFPKLARRGEELLERAKARLAEAPAVLATGRLRAAQQKWLEEGPAREAAARQTWCSAQPTVGNADLYFARQYLDGRTEWFFCDGHMVSALPEGKPTLVGPEGLTRRERNRIQPQRYLDAAKNYPAEEIDRPPASGVNTGAPPSQQAPQTTQEGDAG